MHSRWLHHALNPGYFRSKIKSWKVSPEKLNNHIVPRWKQSLTETSLGSALILVNRGFPPPHTHKPLPIVWVCSSLACVTLPYWCIRAISVHAHSYLRTHHPLTRFPIYRGKFVKAQWRFHDQLSLNVLSTEISCLTLAQLCFLPPKTLTNFYILS